MKVCTTQNIYLPGLSKSDWLYCVEYLTGQ